MNSNNYYGFVAEGPQKLFKKIQSKVTNQSNMETTYKDQLIHEDSQGVVFFLCDEDGDIYENSAQSIEDAKAKIDQKEKEQGGLYDLYGYLV